MSTKEYNEELYNAVDNIRDAFWLDDVIDDLETVMWYAGLSDDFRWSEKIGELVAEYKENYDYRLDIFPAQVLENGTYYIMYNGKYLSNTRPRVSASVPQFVAGRDTIRPQRQEWKITLDATTGRYKIVNLEDNRYLNEKGAFTVSDDTNPYEAVWHSYNIQLLANGKFAIQNAGSAGDKFWTANATRVAAGSSNVNIPDKYIFDIVAMGGDNEQPSS